MPASPLLAIAGAFVRRGKTGVVNAIGKTLGIFGSADLTKGGRGLTKAAKWQQAACRALPGG